MLRFYVHIRPTDDYTWWTLCAVASLDCAVANMCRFKVSEFETISIYDSVTGKRFDSHGLEIS
jgi:hypothetical protein